MAPPQYLTGDKAGIAAFLDKFDVFLFDCDDGEGVRAACYTQHLADDRRATQDEVFGSSYSAAIYISRILRLSPPHNKVFVLGESGVEQELASEGVPFIGGTDRALNRDITSADYSAIASGAALDPDVAVVLAGLDFHPSYLKWALGMAYVRAGARFLATNIDSSLPSAGTLFPGAGASAAPLVKATGQEPLALGKPSQAMMDAIEGRFRFDRSRACMVGDRLNTDIQFGIEGGLGGTLCVLTGVTKREDLLRKGAEVLPSAYVEALGDMLGGRPRSNRAVFDLGGNSQATLPPGEHDGPSSSTRCPRGSSFLTEISRPGGPGGKDGDAVAVLGVVQLPGALDALVGAARLLDVDAAGAATAVVALALGLGGPEAALVAAVVRVRGAGAAADAEEPEGGGSEGESDGEPGDGEHVGAEVQGDVVGFEDAGEGAGEGGEEDGGGEDGEEGEDGGDLGRNRQETAPAAEDGEDGHDDGGEGGPEGNLVRDEHPLGHLPVCIQRLLAGLAQHFILKVLHVVLRVRDGGLHRIVPGGRGGARARGVAGVQAPDLQRVEDEIARALGAEVDGAVAGVGRAVVPQVDLVDVAEQVRGFGVLERGCEGGGVGDGPGAGHVEVGEVRFHEVQAVQFAGAFVGTAEFDEDEADERGHGQCPRHEDAGDPSSFTHAGDGIDDMVKEEG
nr:4-nitrophenylphosphatase [Quercus suber]